MIKEIFIPEFNYNVYYNSNDEYISQYLDRGQLWEWQQIEIPCKAALEQSNTILDLGSHIGCFTLQAKYYNKNCKIIAVEMQEEMFSLLEKNIDNNNLKNVTAINAALGDTAKTITIGDTIRDGSNSNEKYSHTGDKKYNYAGVSIGDGTNQKEMITVDSLNLESCDFIKVDVEEFEFFVFYGAQETLRKFKPVLFFEQMKEEPRPSEYMLNIADEGALTAFNNCGRDVFSFLGSLGYNKFKRFGSSFLAVSDKSLNGKLIDTTNFFTEPINPCLIYSSRPRIQW